ncbi:MAG: cupredoxin domain-containing protein [Acidimicrobiales bacterium]
MAAIAVACIVGLAGCGDDDDDGGAGDASDTTASTTAGDGGAGGSGASASASVTMADFAFSPTELTVASGDVISLQNDDSVPHTFTSDGAGFDVRVEAGASGDARVATSTPGTYDFQCTIHPAMAGKVTVE